MDKGLQGLIDARPDLKVYLTEGWENCTHNGSPSLMSGVAKQSHQFQNHSDSVKLKNRYYDQLFCDENTNAMVRKRYDMDYTVFQEALGYDLHNCSENA